jgi:hypothetical protein
LAGDYLMMNMLGSVTLQPLVEQAQMLLHVKHGVFHRLWRLLLGLPPNSSFHQIHL